MNTANQRAGDVLKACPEWFHSIELAPGVVTPGRNTSEDLQHQLNSLQLPDLHGKSVLDIGAYDGYFSFAVERLGADRVVALDHYVWSTDMVEYLKDWRETQRTGAPLPTPHESRHWHPDELPGRRPFDSARELLGSGVEPILGDFMTMDLTELGQFDVVLYLGILYHMEDPLSAVRRVASVTAKNGLAVIATVAMEIPGLADTALCEFFPGRELNNDPTNWWAPNAKAIEGLCRAAGFREVTILTKGPEWCWYGRTAIKGFLARTGIPKRLGAGDAAGLSPLRYRAYAHARH